MIGIWVLMSIGAGIAAVAMLDTGDDSDGTEAETQDQENRLNEETVLLSNAGDLFASVEFEDEVEDFLAQRVADGDLTEQQAQAYLASAQFFDGPMDVSARPGNDIVLGGSFDDVITGCPDDDLVFGGGGDDLVRLDDGADIYGDHARFDLDVRRLGAVAPVPVDPETAERFDGGDDEVYGNLGNDLLADGIGHNTLFGRQGTDFIISVDQEEHLTPDIVDGGFGADTTVIDEGDTVTTGPGVDWVTLDLYGGVHGDYQLATVTDFDPERDVIELESYAALLTPEDDPEAITIEDLPDGTAALIYVNGVPVLEVVGGAGLTAEALQISTI